MQIDLRSIKQVSDMISWIKRQLGYPIVKVELTDDHIIDNIVLAMNMFIKSASGQSTEEAFYSLMLSGGQTEYVLDEGIIDIISFDDEGYGEKGINTLFTIENQMFNAGMLNFHNLSEGLTLLNYHMAMDFIELIERYTTTSFQWNFDVDDRTLHIMPPPKDEIKSVYDETTGTSKDINSPGWILLKVKQLPGAGSPNFSLEKAYVKLFNKEWVKWYSLALCKMVLGGIRSKFENFASIGNTGISLNGSDLYSQGKEEKDQLEEKLAESETWEGFGIITRHSINLIISITYNILLNYKKTSVKKQNRSLFC